MAVIIAVALLTFVIMLAFENGGSLFSGNQTTVGEVNDKELDYQQFANRVSNVEKYQQSQGNIVNDASRQQIIQSVWDQQVNEVILEEEYEELGLTVSDKELRDILYGSNPPQDLRQRFTDPNTGQYNAVQAQQYIASVKQGGTNEQKADVNLYLEALEKDRLEEKYVSLVMNTMYFPKWFLEKRNVDNSLLANVSYVSVPYATIADSTIKISDDEIQKYINDHKKDFQQLEETRNIEYVTFSAAPSAADSAAARQQMEELKQQFDTVSVNYETFVARNSTLPFYNGFITGTKIQQVNKDSILSAPVGQVYGPYFDPSQNGGQSAYALSKIIAQRNLPDTVKLRHILVATHQVLQTGERMPVRSDEDAKRIADSIMQAHKSGANFDTLVVKHSDDPGSNKNGGVYEGVSTGQMVPAFNDFVFTNSTGTTGIVKTDYGYHYIEILSQKGSSPAYKIAYVAKPIIASQETDNIAQNAASTFVATSQNYKDFNDNWEKSLKAKGVNKFPAADIRPMDFSIPGLDGSSRKLIKDAFEADKGDVLGPERIGENYVVAVVTEINKKGLVSVNRVRPMVEPILRNKKKAEQIMQQMGAITTLEAVGSKFNVQVQTVDSLRFTSGNNPLAYEPKVTGAAFNPAFKGKVSAAIPGQAGVYVIRVNSVGTTPIEAASIEEQRRNLVMQSRQSLQSQMQYGGGVNPYVDVLKKDADIEDYRPRFY